MGLTGGSGVAATGSAALAGGATAGTTLTATAGTFAFSAGVGATSAIAAAVGGVAGSVASQLVGKAIGATDSFSLRQAVGSGLTAGLTAGAGAALSGASGTLGKVLSAEGWRGAASSAVLSSLAGQAGSRLAGLDTSFSWRSVAANAVAASISASVTSRLSQGLKLDLGSEAGQFGQDLLGGAVGGVVSLHTRRAAGIDQRVDYGQVAVDAFGNTLGNSAAGEHSRRALATLERQHRADLINAELQGRLAEGELQGAALAQALGRSGLPSGSRSHDGLWDRLPADGSRVLLDQRRGTNANGTAWTEQDWARRINDSFERRRFGGARVDFNTVRTDGVRDRRPAQVEALPEIVRTAVRSTTAQRLEAVEQWREGGVASWDSYRGSFAGDMTASIMTMFFNAGAGGVSSAVSAFGMGTDQRFNREVQASIGLAARNPELVAAAGQAWWAKPLDQKASDLGTAGIGALLTGGRSLIKYLDTVADVGAATQKLSLLRRNSEMREARQDWSVVDGLEVGREGPVLGSNPTSLGRIRLDPSLSQADRVFAGASGRAIAENPVAIRSYARLQQQGTDVVYINDPDFGFSGLWDPPRNRVTVNLAENLSPPRDIVSTLIHEASHQTRFFRGYSTPTRYEEYLSFRREALFELGRPPTLGERRTIWDAIANTPDYQRLPTGKVPVLSWETVK
jgi:hypothetical protein